MKVNNLKYYPLFIFKSSDFCLQTADNDLLQFIFDINMNIKTNFRINDEMLFKMDNGNLRKFKITNIEINNVVDDTDLNQMGIISYGCSETIGKHKDELMFNFIEMTEIEME
ncbi:hypothetical protein [Flavobacterium sp.]|uniref:hypothetical protein n=1 Tax=Flavobacterium sp. TaxID=239 RepID=UPI0040487266